MSEKMKACVTGGAGFIGSHLAQALVKKGHDVVVLDDLSSGSLPSIEKLKADFIKGDLRDYEVVKKATRGCEVVYHLGAVVGVADCVRNPKLAHEVNSQGTFNVAHACLENDSKLVYASSAGVYGDSVNLPINEKHPINPKNLYSATKYIGEIYCSSMTPNHVILRFFNVYGPGQEKSAYSSILINFIQKILNQQPLQVFGTGEQTRDYVHVSDVVNALTLAGEKKVSGIFNIGSGTQMSVNDVYSILKGISNREIRVLNLPWRTWEVSHSFADISLARKVLGFNPSVDIKTGLGNLFE